jgi:hypothetical protein
MRPRERPRCEISPANDFAGAGVKNKNAVCAVFHDERKRHKKLTPMQKITRIAPSAIPPAVKEIARLHSEIMLAAKTSLKKAIRIGEILTSQKQSLKHGEWLPWIEKNLSFTVRTAQNYVRCWERRADLNTQSVAYLSDAIRLLAKPTDAQIVLLKPPPPLSKPVRVCADEQSAAAQLVSNVEQAEGYSDEIQAWLRRVDAMPADEIEDTPAEGMTLLRGFTATGRLILAESHQEGFWRQKFKSFEECCFAFVGEEYLELLAKESA